MSEDKSLEYGKAATESTTIKGAVVSVFSAVAGVAAILHYGAPPEIMITALTTAAGTIVGGLMSIIGRVGATEQIVRVKKKKKVA